MKKLFFSARFWKICILFPVTVFLVYAECTFIWMIVNYWNSDRLFALVGVYFFEVTGMLLAVCVISCVRCFRKYPTEHIPLPDKKMAAIIYRYSTAFCDNGYCNFLCQSAA